MKKFILVLCSVFIACNLYAYKVNVSWEAVTKNVNNEDCEIQFYTVYWGEQSRGNQTTAGAYTKNQLVNTGTSTQVDGLVEGIVYYFAATATGVNGVTSALSEEVRYDRAQLPVGTQGIEAGGEAIFHPNPYKKGGSEPKFFYNLDSDKEIEIFVYNKAGKKIWSRTYSPGSNGGSAGSNSPEFNLETDGGAAVKNGTYIYRILSGSTVLKEGKFVILK